MAPSLGRLRELGEAVEELEEEIESVSPEAVKRIGRRVDRVEEVVERFEEGEIPHKAALRGEAKGLAGEIHGDVEEGVLEEGDIEAFDEAFGHLRYGKTEEALESLEEAREKANLLSDYSSLKDEFSEVHKSLERRTRELEERRRELEGLLEETRGSDLKEVDGSVAGLEEAVDSYNRLVSEALEELLHEPVSRVSRMLEHADSFPLVRGPEIDVGELSGEEDMNVYDLLEFQELSRGKQEHMTDEPGEIRGALNGNLAGLRALEELPETDFLKLDLEEPGVARERAKVYRRFLRRIGCPTEELDEFVERLGDVDGESLELASLAENWETEIAELESDVQGELEEVEEELDRTEEALDEVTPPRELPAF